MSASDMGQANGLFLGFVPVLDRLGRGHSFPCQAAGVEVGLGVGERNATKDFCPGVTYVTTPLRH
jgi:hypothetical protein